MRTPSRRDVLLAAGSAGLALHAGGRQVLAQSGWPADRRVVRRLLPGGAEQGALPARRQGARHHRQGRDLHRHRRPAPEGEGGRRHLGRGRPAAPAARHAPAPRASSRSSTTRSSTPRPSFPGMAEEYCVGGDVFSTVLAWNTKTYGDKRSAELGRLLGREEVPGQARVSQGRGRCARAGADGGRRAARQGLRGPVARRPASTRAIKKIKELKPHIAVWWASGAQHAQLMKDGEVDMITGWNGRFDVAAKDGGKVAYTFNQALLDYDCYAIPKGAPNKDLADEVPGRDQQAAVSGRVHQIHHVRADQQEGLRRSARSRRTMPSGCRRTPTTSPSSCRSISPGTSNRRRDASAAYQNMLTE